MRIKRVVLLVFLLTVFLAPRNFVDAAYGDISPESITSFSEEVGWLHDGSNTTGIVSYDAGDTISSDGDNVSLTSDVDGGSFNITAAVTLTDYPFLEISITSITEGDGWKLEQYDGAAWATLQAAYETDEGINRYNMRSLDTSIQELRVNLTQTATVIFDYIEAYTIANFTYTSASATTTDVCYVDTNDDLVIDYTAGIGINWAHDPLLSVDTSTYNVLNISTPTGLNYFTFKAGLSPWEFILQSTTDTRAGISSGTLTDFYMVEFGSSIISAITFIQTSDWQEVAELVVIFGVGIDPAALWALNGWYMLFGALLVISAGSYAALKIRAKDYNSNLCFWPIVAFFIGWALIIGVIL